MKYVTKTILIRWILTTALLFGVLWEAGPITAIVLLLLSVRVELDDYLRCRMTDTDNLVDVAMDAWRDAKNRR